MNVFMILIMAVMLGMYQYFTAKRSSDVTLNKDERAFEVELNCLKQFHDYGATRNEAQLTEGFINPGYTCANAENIKMYKYCLNSGIETSCADTNITEHCIATTMSKDNLDNSLKSLLFKKGIEEIKAGNILKGKKISINNHPASTSKTTSFGLVSCVDAERISQNEKLAKDNCKKEGKFATKQPDGSWICTDVPELADCTAHEVSVSTSGVNCTGPINGKYCCPNTSIADKICGSDPQIKATWNPSTRFYICTNGEDECNKGTHTMQVLDENNAQIGSGYISIVAPEKFYTAKYNTSTKTWDCIPNAETLIDKCKTFVLNNNHAYTSVSNLTTANGTPICYGASEKSPSALEVCSACGTAELNKVTGQWYCEYPTTWTDLRLKGSAYIDKVKGTYVYDAIKQKGRRINEKGVDACFQGCTDEMIASIKTGKPNDVYWGLSWNSNSKLWECFTCEHVKEPDGKIRSVYVNDRCVPHNDGVNRVCPSGITTTITNCNSDNSTEINGRCVLDCCDESFQKRGTDGACYTKWCRNIPSDINIEIGKPTAKLCEDGLRMVWNYKYDCVYCIRPDPIRIE